ncbi:Gfo/Idh/MocA family protein [Streptomyces iconiensis]|uniref:Gfo/Idh/MocA family oxidoreductase n=1 Tax=Streptomyces iconiensis TaxID=1384038 RepID=A0ABT6ZQK3_9ACTN|nr:Gfo/Idh/MocA family oxidoreductase [Streptomyces iconiensis]MDJ1131340.1 Gfo/Idh/MocA family oxidoreductase [Streptomyces iconiensis]
MARVMVVGLRRGLVLARWCRRVGFEVAAVCDPDPGLLAEAAGEFPSARAARGWEELAEADVEAVVLAHDFDAHAEPALRFLERGVHVLSECAACVTEDEGRALIEAADRSPASYSFAENYVEHPHVRLIGGLVAEGAVGDVELIECDYVHGLAPAGIAALAGDPAHWRGRVSPTAYCTHTLTPVLDVTGARPVEVTAHPVGTAARPMAVVLVTRLSTGALAVTRQTFLQGEPDSHWSWLSVRGSQGLAESLRAPGEDSWSVRLRNEPWAHGGSLRDEVRTPPPVRVGGNAVSRMEEGTARVVEAFWRTVTEGAAPRVPVRTAVAASLVGVAGARSLTEGSVPVPVPDVAGSLPDVADGGRGV